MGNWIIIYKSLNIIKKEKSRKGKIYKKKKSMLKFIN